jgi:LmbE family N-acetylglucosaminyl deacetylase
MKRVLIFAAHLDDVEFGMGGTCSLLSRDHRITLCVFCQGDRPGAEYVQQSRQEVMAANLNDLHIAEYLQLDYSDMSLDQVPFLELSSYATSLVQKISPEIVFTHYSQDIHSDHIIVSNATRVACRPRESCSVKELYEYSIPGSTEWSRSGVEYNTYFDTSEVSQTKYSCISRYKTEVKSEIDPLNLEYIKHRDLYYGGLCGYRVAEPFLNIYTKK